ncbi:MAG: PaaI family thioesterase [Candidatus Hermodarchaeia archaeon]|jgi:acyl-coenzyme A thioesterase PaaI-like protein
MKKKAIQDQWSEYGTMCWGCGRNNEHGFQLKSYWKGDETVATWHPKPYHLAFPGTLCGGVIATLIDCHATNTANAAAFKHEGHEQDSETDKGYVTGSLFVKYLRPTSVDKPVTLRARVKEVKGRKITVTCSLYSDDMECAIGEVVAIQVQQNL